MFTGITLYYLLKELNFEKKRKIKDVIRRGNIVSIYLKDNFITANLSPRLPYVYLKKIKGQGYYSTMFKGKRVLGVEQLGLDRFLEIRLEDDLRIIFELFGRRSDCLLLRGNEILNSLKGFKGGTYKIPPYPGGLNLLEATQDEIIDALINENKINGLTVGYIKNLKLKGLG